MTPNMAFATGAAAGAASARETASRVAAGGGRAAGDPRGDDPRLCRRARRRCDRPRRASTMPRSTPIPSSARTPRRRRAGRRWSTTARKAGSSLGAVVECVATGVPAGWGAPLYAKLDAELAAAMMSINAVKGVEIGDGFAAARLRGEENADAMRAGRDGAPHFLANHAGGVARRHFDRPAGGGARRVQADLLDPDPGRRRSTATGEETEISTKGRHDPCVGIRGAPVVEAMMALVLADQKLLHRAQCGERGDEPRRRRARRAQLSDPDRGPACSTAPARRWRPRARRPARRGQRRECLGRAGRRASRRAWRASTAEPIILPPGEGDARAGRRWPAWSTGCSRSASSAATMSSPSAAA